MSRKSRFLVGLTAAVLTFGGLFATLGPQRFNSCHPCHRMQHCCMYEEHERHCCESATYKHCEHDAESKEMKTDSLK